MSSLRFGVAQCVQHARRFIHRCYAWRGSRRPSLRSDWRSCVLHRLRVLWSFIGSSIFRDRFVDRRSQVLYLKCDVSGFRPKPQKTAQGLGAARRPGDAKSLSPGPPPYAGGRKRRRQVWRPQATRLGARHGAKCGAARHRGTKRR